ncbi:hypothetical protein Pcac1_g6612 [Phytophthora cactorum]|nr:hypothetical protein Pcac1_g6612 [Phytophthora cactorum]KAG2824802.1 hypothetical protein PC111_g9682 [Phytophthora cactorum]KAG2825782.1 hypothetical protein PC112_g9543 [Phytophthora cactorum]KAG2904468.1 hypothetical protein PC114_g11870 [Phytophthora cactorum]KAG3017690.1 hypothetical protein PC119_g10937 [Phytophthora cactorum]
MFLTAVARPRCDLATGIQFDGKLGIWPFVEQRAAIRDSERRPAGTIETKSINVTKVTYRKMLLDKLLPAISQRWPWSVEEGTPIKLQQYNASPHIPTDDQWFCAAVEEYGRRVELVFQLLNSPD